MSEQSDIWSGMVVRISKEVSFGEIVEHGDRPIGIDREFWIVLVKTDSLKEQIILNLLHHEEKKNVFISKEQWGIVTR